MDFAISLRDVSKTFRVPLDRAATLKYRVVHPRSSGRWRAFKALDSIGFDVDHGEFLGIIGHNGCGKSTLLKILAGIYRADGGTVNINGMVSPFLELGVGFNPELTARENVFLNGAVLGLTRSSLRDRVDSIIAFAEIEEFAEQKLKNFSSGMQVRLAFAVAIEADAGILLMDEVLAVGDARFQEKCFDVFARYKREGRTIILVTHDTGSVDLYCDRCLLLDHGRLLADGPPKSVTGQYRRMVGARSDDSVDAPVAQVSNRFGSRELEVLEVRLTDETGRRHHTFSTGRPMQVEVEYRCNNDQIGSFICALSFQRSDGLVVAKPDTSFDSRPLVPVPKGERGIIRYSVDEVPLLAAGYLVTAGLYDIHMNYAYDHLEDVASFRVVDESGRHGLVTLNGSWTAEVAPPVVGSVTTTAAVPGRQ